MADRDGPTGQRSRSAVDGGTRRPGWRFAALSAAGVVALLAVTFGVFGRGWFGASPAAPGNAASPGGAAASAALLGRGDYQPRDLQQAGACDGVPAVEPDDLRLLDPVAKVTAATVCTDVVRDRPGDGRWQVRQVTDVPAAALPTLIAALTARDVVPPADGACTAMLVMVSDFVLTVADGTRIRPGVPGDGCHPDQAVLDALQAATAGAPDRTAAPVSQIASEQQVITGCDSAASAPAIWLESSAGQPASSEGATGDAVVGKSTSVPPAAPPTATGKAEPGEPEPVGPIAGLLTSPEVAVCRYAPDGGGKGGPLTATGMSPAGSVTAALAHLGTQAPAGCPSPATPETSPQTDWLSILPLPAPGFDEPVPPPPLLVELGGCRRVVGGSPLTLRGYIGTDAATAMAMATLADTPAR